MKSRRIYFTLALLAFVGCAGWILRNATLRARDMDVRINCTANLRAIGQVLLSYAAKDISGAFPDDLSRLIRADEELHKRCRCPQIVDSRPSYFYVLGLSNRSPASTVVMFEESRNHLDEIGSVLFADGSAKLIKKPDLDAIINTAMTTAKVVPVTDLSGHKK